MRRIVPPQTAVAPGRQRRVVQSAARTLHLYHQLIRAPEGRKLAEISRDCNLSEVTTFRLLQTLVAEGLVRKDPERGRYRLSPLFWLTAVAAFPDVGETQRRMRRTLAELAQHTGARAVIGVPYVGTRLIGLICPAFPEGDDGLLEFGAPNVPMHASAAGKCYLASLPEAELQEWVKRPLPPVTPHTITEPEALLAEVTQVRARGYAVSRQECVAGLASMAAPVLDATGAHAGAIQLTGPLADVSAAAIQRWLPPLQQVSQSLSEMASGLARLA